MSSLPSQSASWSPRRSSAVGSAAAPTTTCPCPPTGRSSPWSLGRTAARTAIGSIAGSCSRLPCMRASRIQGRIPPTPESSRLLVSVGGWITFISVAIVTVAESRCRALGCPAAMPIRSSVATTDSLHPRSSGPSCRWRSDFQCSPLSAACRYDIRVALSFADRLHARRSRVGHRFGRRATADVQAP